MAARVYYSAESTGDSTTTSSTFGDKVSYTLTAAQQTANAVYVVFWSALVNVLSTSVAARTRLYNDTGAVEMARQDTFPKDTTNYQAVGGFAFFTAAATPADNTFSIEFSNSNNITTTTIREARIVILELTSADFTAESTGESTTTSSTPQDKTTLTQTTLAHTYAVLYSAEMGTSSTTSSEFLGILEEDTVDITSQAYDVNSSSDYVPINGLYVVTLTAASHTYKIQYARAGIAGTIKIRNARILLLDLSEFDNAYTAASRTRATQTNSTTYNDVVSLTQTPQAGDHLWIGAAQIDNDSTSADARIRYEEGATPTVLQNMNKESTNATASVHEVSSFLVAVRNLAASSTTWAIAHSTESTNTVGTTYAEIAMLQLFANAAAGLAPIWNPAPMPHLIGR